MAQYSDFDLLREARRRGYALDNEDEILRQEARRRGFDIAQAGTEGTFTPDQVQSFTRASQKETTPARTISGEVLEILKGIPSGAVGLLESAATGAAAILPDEAEKAVRRQVGDIAGSLREPFEAAAGYEESIGRKAGEALGSTAPFFALGPLGMAGRLGAAGLGVGAGAGEARVRAEQEGGMEERGAATALGALVGATEVIPVFRFADRILDRLPDPEKGLLLEYVKRAAAAGGEEFAQEASANVAQNLIEKGLYNPEQDVFEGAAEEGAYGFGVGAFIQGITDLALGRRVRGAVAEPGGEDERTGLGAEQTVEGADTGGIGLPVSGLGAERLDAEESELGGMAVPRRDAGRLDERAEDVQPALGEEPRVVSMLERREAQLQAEENAEDLADDMESLRGTQEYFEQFAPKVATLEATLNRAKSALENTAYPDSLEADSLRQNIAEIQNLISSYDNILSAQDYGSVAREWKPLETNLNYWFNKRSYLNRAGERVTTDVVPLDILQKTIAQVDPTQPSNVVPLEPARFQMEEPDSLPKSSAATFEPAKLEQLRVPEYKSREKLIEMPIDDFLALAKPGRMKIKEDEVTKLLEEGTKFSSVPFLNAYQKEDGTLKVEGHEGRHRARALKAAGYETMPVIIRSDIRWSEQDDPSKRDYVSNWPTKIVSEEGNKSIPMPISREQSIVPYEMQQSTEETYSPVKNVPLFKMAGRPVKGMAAPEVQKIVSQLSQGWANKPNIKIVNTYKELPPAYRSDKYKGMRGMLLGNDVYIVAANAGSASEVKGTLFHESLGHYGLRQLFNDRLDKALKDIYATNTAVRNQADAWLKRKPGVYRGADHVSRAVEEVLAAKSEAGVIKEPGIRAAFNRLAAMIRKFIRGMGIPLDYTNNDIHNILLESAERVRSGPVKMATPDAKPRYQMSQYNQILTGMLEKNQQLPEWSQAVGDGVVGALSTLPENLRRGQYYVYSMPHMVELLENYIPRIRAIDRYIGYRASYTTDLMKTASENHAKYSRIVQRTPGEYDKFKDVVNDINYFQVPIRDQSVKDLLDQDRATLSPQKQKYYDIAKRFYALPEQFQNAILSADERSGLFADYRKMGDKKFDIFADVYGGKLGMGVIKDLRERFEKERLPMYAPLVRGEGAHWLYYETTDGRQVKQSFENAAKRELEIKRVTEEGLAKTDTIDRATRASELRQKGPPPVGFLGEIVSTLEDKLSDMPEAQRREIVDSVYDTFLQYLPSNMLRQELTSRQTFEVDGAMQFGVLGADPDVLAVYDRTMPKMAYQLGNLKFALPIENAMAKVVEQAKMYEIAVRDKNIPDRLKNRKLLSPKAVFDGVEDMRRRLDFAYNPSYSPLVNATATANYVYSIAGNVSSALINTTVLAMLTFPSLVAQYGFVRSTAAMTRAMNMFLKGGVDDQGNFTFGNAATGELKTFFDYLEKRGAIGIAAEQELRQAQRAAVSGYESTMDKINFVAGYVFKNSERFNREVTMLASFMLARETRTAKYPNGKGFRTAAEEAIRLNSNINGTVLPELASRMYQTNLGRVILTFRTFALTQIIALSRSFGRALNIVDATPEERSYARKQLLGIYGATYMVAGLKGMPLFGAAEVLAAALMGDDDEPYDLQQEVLDSVGLLGLNGPLNAALQVDIASRTGFNGMLWRDDPKRLAELGYVFYAIERIGGPTFGLVNAQVRGIENLMAGEVQRGFESILPAPLRNPLKAARYATDGALTKNGIPIVDDVSAWNSTMQVFGFAPAELAATQEQIGATFEISDKLRNRRTALLTNAYAATESGDDQAVSEAYDAIDKFNATNPDLMISPKSLRASFRERRRRAMEAVNGIYLPRNLRAATEALMADPY